MLIFGIQLQTHNNAVIVQTIPYEASCSIPEGDFEKACEFEATIAEDMVGPVYMYYRITNFYQNHRSFVMYISPPQLDGDDISETKNCMDKMTTGEDNKILVPCGHQGWSYFNDEINVTVSRGAASVCEDISLNSMSVCTNQTNIALDVDKNLHFAASEDFDPEIHTRSKAQYNFEGSLYRGPIEIPELNDESLMVWMRYAATSKFHKLHSIIHHDLQKGDEITISVNNKFDVKHFDGQKEIILSTMGSFGGQHVRLATIFIATASSGLAAIAFLLLTHIFLTFKYQE